MTNQKNNLFPKDYKDYQNDFVKITHTLFKRKWLITLGVIIFTILSIIISFALPKVYKSEAFYLLSGPHIPLEKTIEKPEISKDEILSEYFKPMEEKILSIEDKISVLEYKKYSSLFTSPRRFIHFIEEKNLFKGKELERIKANINTPQDLSKRINTVYSYSKEDLQKVAQISAEEETFVLGVNLVQEDNSPQNAQTFVETMGEFIRDSIIYCKLRDYMSTKYNYSATRSRKYENLIIDADFNLNQLTQKIQDIQSIYSKYPQSSRIENRQVVSVEKEGYRYLSPITQLVGIESRIADIKEELSTYQREKEKAEINYEFFSQMKELVEKNESGEDIFQGFLSLKEEFFKKKDLTDDTVKEVFNQLKIDVEIFKTLFNENMRFIYGPSLPQVPIKPRKPVIVIAGFFIGLFLFVFLAFVIEFWMRHKKSITEK